jgi:hypothetical protein
MNAVDQLLLNARLRDEIEPFVDESIGLLDAQQLSLEQENEFLASMLDWERAPVLPIGRWFDPELRPPLPDSLGDEELFVHLHDTIAQLYEKHVVLEYTDHLSDRELYCLILRDILPAQEKRLSSQTSVLRWQCVDEQCDCEVWLAYYASDRQRQAWLEEHGQPLPEKRTPPYGRRLPTVRC